MQNTLITNTFRNSSKSFEVSAHTCSSALLRELKNIFDQDFDPALITAIPTFQKSEHDLVEIGEAVEKEKDDLLNKFFSFAHKLCDHFNSLGYWADFIDPCSGYPMLGDSRKSTYNEVAGIEELLKYRTMNVGCCKVILHPTWNSHVYPATIFVQAPLEVITEYLMNVFDKE